MRPLVLIVLLLTLVATGFWQYRQHQASSNTHALNSNNTDSSTLPVGNHTAKENSLMQQAISHLNTRPKDQNHKNHVPAAKAKPEPTVSIDDLNLDLPVTVHPTTPALTLPNNKTLILEPKKYRPSSVIVGGGIDWDDKEDKAKGANITITIPTG